MFCTSIASIIVIYLFHFFFIRNSDINTNYSTDKKIEYITINGKEELLSSQKFISDLEYSMRYDTERFVVFKYRKQDFYRFKENERVFLVIEEADVPSPCVKSELETEYNNCYIKVDDSTEEYYLSSNKGSYRIMVKSPNVKEFNDGIKNRINYMITTFKIEKNNS